MFGEFPIAGYLRQRTLASNGYDGFPDFGSFRDGALLFSWVGGSDKQRPSSERPL